MHRTVRVGTLNSKSAEVNGTKPKSLRTGREMPHRQQKSRAREFPYSALKVFYRCFQQMTSAMRESTERSGSTILRPLTSARNYATIADRKSANSEGNMVYQKNNGYFKPEKKIPSQNSLPLTNKFDWVSCGGAVVT